LISEFLLLCKAHLTEVLPFLTIGFCLVGVIQAQKSAWLTCNTCRPEKWVCKVCRKRKAFPDLCQMRKMVTKRMESIEDIKPSKQDEISVKEVTYVRQPAEIMKLPKLRIRAIPGRPSEEIRGFEQGIDLPFTDAHIFVEGYRVNSYDELVQIASQDTYKDNEFLEVVVLSIGIIAGG